MGNDVTTTNPFGNAAVAVKDRQAMAQKAAESAQNSTRAGAPDGSEYMNFSGKRGLYTIGKEKRRVEADEMWVLNIASFEDGWVCWKGGKPTGTRMANIYTGVPVSAPDPEEGGPFNTGNGEGWSQAKGWVAKSIDYDEQGYFKINSISGVAEMADMIEEVSRRMASGVACWPVFHYDMEEFEAKGHKNFKPIFKVYGWLDDDAIGKLDDEDADVDDLIEASAGGTPAPVDKQVEAPAEKKSAKKVDVKTPAEAEEPARGRRRRRGAAA